MNNFDIRKNLAPFIHEYVCIPVRSLMRRLSKSCAMFQLADYVKNINVEKRNKRARVPHHMHLYIVLAFLIFTLANSRE